MFEQMESHQAVIKVIGVGGGGGNAVQHMAEANLDGVEFICTNTDAQALKNMKACDTLQIGEDVTKGLGAGADPDIGHQAAMDDRDRIQKMVEGSDMLFIIAGMGGGTGSGAAPVVAKVARELGILTVGVVSTPFTFEGSRRLRVAFDGIKELSQHVDSLITIPSNKLQSVFGKQTSLLDAFRSANDVLLDAVQGITGLITRPGLINVDFADVRTVMSEMGMAMMGSGTAKGEDRAREAAETAVASPLLEDIDLMGANGILVNVTAGMDLAIGEFEEVANTVKNFVSENATVVVGTVIDPDMRDELRVTIVATGLDMENIREQVKRDHSGDINHDEHISPRELLIRIFGESAVKGELNLSGVKLITPESTSDEELAELIAHLSNVYRSVGGDELIVHAVKDIPPNSISNVKEQSSRNKSASR